MLIKIKAINKNIPSRYFHKSKQNHLLFNVNNYDHHTRLVCLQIVFINSPIQGTDVFNILIINEINRFNLL